MRDPNPRGSKSPVTHACSRSSAGRAGRKGMAAVSVVHVLCIYYVYAFRNCFVRFPTAGRYAIECCVTSHDTSATVFGNLPGFEHRRVIHQKISEVALSYLPPLIFGESSPLTSTVLGVRCKRTFSMGNKFPADEELCPCRKKSLLHRLLSNFCLTSFTKRTEIVLKFPTSQSTRAVQRQLRTVV